MRKLKTGRIKKEITSKYPPYALCSSQFQLRPAPPSHPPGLLRSGAVARLVSPGDVVFANFALPGGRAFANPGASPELLTRTRYPIRI